MSKGVVILIVVSATAVSVAGYGVLRSLNRSTPQTPLATVLVVHSDTKLHTQISYLSQGSCTFILELPNLQKLI